MQTKIVFEAPKPDAVRYLIEQMVDDPFVGNRPFQHSSDEKWIEKTLDNVQIRYEHDVLATVAYRGSSIVGMAFSHKLNGERECVCGNLKQDNEFWKMGNFFVLKHLRGQGIGTLALKSFMSKHAGKVAYYAEMDNKASQAVAIKCGLMHTHDFRMSAVSRDDMQTYPIGKCVQVRGQNYYCHAYLGAIPEPSELINPRIMRYELA